MNRLNFINEMKEQIKKCIGEVFDYCLLNDNKGYATTVKILINTKPYKITNNYCLFDYENGVQYESSSFNCNCKNVLPTFSKGVTKKVDINSIIKKIYIVKNTVTKSYDDEVIIVFDYDKALVFETESVTVVLYRDIVFDKTKVELVNDFEEVIRLLDIKKEQKEMQVDNDIKIDCKQIIEEL